MTCAGGNRRDLEQTVSGRIAPEGSRLLFRGRLSEVGLQVVVAERPDHLPYVL